MSLHAEKARMTSGTTLEPATVNVRIKISALWTTMMFVFAYVDLFSLYRADVRADLEAGQMSVFPINQVFLLFTTAYVAIPALMAFGTLVLRPAISRIANIALSVLYAVTIIGASIGEGYYYYLLGSTLEVALLAAVAYYAWTWPKLAASSSADRPEVRADPAQNTAG
jgi:hypothetical protein